MSKKARRWKQTAVNVKRIVDRNAFFEAVAKAEKRFGAVTRRPFHFGG